MTTGSQAGAREIRWLVGNLPSVGALLAAPLQTLLLARLLGPADFGRWSFAFALLHVLTQVTSRGPEVFVRREIARAVHDVSDAPRERTPSDVLGAGIVVTVLLALVAAGLLWLAAPVLARRNADPPVAAFVRACAPLPLVSNLAVVLVASLQSAGRLAGVAALRGLVVPLIQLAALGVALRFHAGVLTVFALVTGAGLVMLAGTAALTARAFPARDVLAAAARPRMFGAVMRFTPWVAAPAVLWALGTTMDVYVLGRFESPATVGVYAAAMLFAGVLPALRGLIDPIVSTQLSVLGNRGDLDVLTHALRRLTRLVAWTLAPAVALLFVAGPFLLSVLLGHPAPDARWPLRVLLAGQFVGGAAIASVLVPLRVPGPLLLGVAGVAVTLKTVGQLFVAPRWGLLGVACVSALYASGVPLVLSVLGSRRVGVPFRVGNLLTPFVALVLAALSAAVGNLSVAALGAGSMSAVGVLFASLLALVLALASLWPWLDADERDALRNLRAYRSAPP